MENIGNYEVGDHVQVKLSGGRIDSVDLSVADRHRGSFSLIVRSVQLLKKGAFDGPQYHCANNRRW